MQVGGRHPASIRDLTLLAAGWLHWPAHLTHKGESFLPASSLIGEQAEGTTVLLVLAGPASGVVFAVPSEFRRAEERSGVRLGGIEGESVETSLPRLATALPTELQLTLELRLLDELVAVVGAHALNLEDELTRQQRVLLAVSLQAELGPRAHRRNLANTLLGDPSAPEVGVFEARAEAGRLLLAFLEEAQIDVKDLSDVVILRVRLLVKL